MRRDRILVCVVVSLLLAACAGSGGSRPAKRGATANANAAQLNLKLGQGYMEQGEYEVALEKLNRALELDPGLAEAHTVIAVLYEQIKRPEKAEEHYRRSLALRPESGMMLNNFGGFLCRLQRFDEADAQFAKALDDPFYRTPEVALANAGSCALRSGDRDKAERYFRLVLERDPGNSGVLLDMASLMYAKRDFMRARAFIQRFESAAQPAPEALLLASRIEREAGDARRAQEYIDTLRREFPDSPLVQAIEEPGSQ